MQIHTLHPVFRQDGIDQPLRVLYLVDEVGAKELLDFSIEKF
jgi:hypothetical protein